MKYMHSEWEHRLRHWLETLERDLYIPLGPVEVEAFLTMEHLTPAQAEKGCFAPMAPGSAWGRAWEYCWMRGSIVLPEEARDKRIAMDLQTGGESMLFDCIMTAAKKGQWIPEGVMCGAGHKHDRRRIADQASVVR